MSKTAGACGLTQGWKSFVKSFVKSRSTSFQEETETLGYQVHTQCSPMGDGDGGGHGGRRGSLAQGTCEQRLEVNRLFGGIKGGEHPSLRQHRQRCGGENKNRL